MACRCAWQHHKALAAGRLSVEITGVRGCLFWLLCYKYTIDQLLLPRTWAACTAVEHADMHVHEHSSGSYVAVHGRACCCASLHVELTAMMHTVCIGGTRGGWGEGHMHSHDSNQIRDALSVGHATDLPC